ncbi:MAG TPA: type IV pilus assembly protein PilM [Nitrospirota bacterium]|nr:type IV pilus assembly protein PilM [Nitrospirota bacterium]
MGLFESNEITGVDIGAGGIKAVRIKHGKCPKLVAAAIIEFPPDAAAAEPISADLRYLLSEKKIGRKNVITQVPGKDLTIRSLSLPKMPLTELGEAVRWEAKRHISYSLDAALVEYLITGEKKEGTVDKIELIMVAADESKVREHLLLFDDARIKITAVDANALALRNILFFRGQNAAVDTLAVDIGAGKMEIDIFKRGILRFSRCLEIGGADITRLVADDLNINVQDAEAFKRDIDVLTLPEKDKTVAAIASRLDAFLMEIRRSVEYYRTTCREKAVDRVVLTGGTALMKGLPEYFSRSLDLPVELCNPFSVLKYKDAIGAEFGPLAPHFSAAVGLALRKM